MIGFIALCQSRSAQKQNGASRDNPASVLAPESGARVASQRCSVSSAQVDSHFNHETETFVALVITVGVENVVPNICPVAGFEVITIGRFCGDNRGFGALVRDTDHASTRVTDRKLCSVTHGLSSEQLI